jgi:hypothetical protein
MESMGWPGAIVSPRRASPTLVQGSALREAMEKQEVWLWLNFDLADERASATIGALPHLPPGALAMLRSADDSQQIDGFGQVIAGVVADYERCDPPDERRVVRWNFAMTPYLFIGAASPEPCVEPGA